MTRRDLAPPPGFIIQELWKWVTRLAITTITLVLLAVTTPLWGNAKAIWLTPGVLAEVQVSLADMRAELRRATGEDRVIRQPPGQSYVQDPVEQGETVILYITAARTTLGRNCRLTNWTPLFTDASNITLPGARLASGPVSRQITDEPTKLRIEIAPPAILVPGRVELYLALDYDCAGKQVPDRTDTVTYRLIPKS